MDSALPLPGVVGPFVGRHAELAALDDAARLSERGCAWVHVDGASGLGKSSLIARFIAELRVRAPETLVLGSRCYERESVPFKALDGAIDQLARVLRAMPADERARLWPVDSGALSAVFPSLAPGDLASTPAQVRTPREELARATAGLSHLLVALCARQPVVLFIDDVQWSDVDSAELLTAVLATRAPARLCIVTCGRETGDAPSVFRDRRARLAPAVALVDIALAPLDGMQARALARSLLGGGESSAVDTLVEEAEGNPFFLDTLCRAHGGGGLGQVRTLDAALHARIEALPRGARQLAVAVAVAGQPLASPLAFRAAELQQFEPKLVVQLCGARVLSVRFVAGRETLECYHDRVRSSLVSALAVDARRTVHHRLAAVLTSAGSDPERIGEHHREAGEAIHAARCFEVAAERATRALAFARAARLLDAVATLDDTRSPEALSRLRERQAEASEHAGRAADAHRAYTVAATLAQGERALSLSSRAVEQRWRGGQLDGGHDAMRDALLSVGLSWPRTRAGVVLRLLKRRVQLWWRRYRPRSRIPARPERRAEAAHRALVARVDTTYFFAGFSLLASPLDGFALHSESLLWALEAGDPPRVGRGLSIESAVRAMLGRADARSWRMLEVGSALAAEGDVHCRAQALAGRAWAGLATTSFRGADDAAREASRLYLSEPGTRYLSEVALMRFFRMASLFHLGRFVELRALYAQHVSDCEERADLLWEYVGAAHFGWVAPLLAGDAHAIHEVAERVAVLERRVGVSFAHASAIGVRAWAHRVAGDGPAAVAALDALWPQMRRQHLLHAPMFVMRALVDRVSALLCTLGSERPGSRPWRTVFDRAARDTAHIARMRLAAAKPAALLFRAALDATRRPASSTVSALREAEAALDAAELLPWAMAARRCRAELTVDGALRESADRYFRDAGSRAPARVAAVFLPWPGWMPVD